jgi:hypothetical protein
MFGHWPLVGKSYHHWKRKNEKLQISVFHELNEDGAMLHQLSGPSLCQYSAGY